MYEVHWVKPDGTPGIKKFGTLYHLAEWIQNLHYWGIKAKTINVRWVDEAALAAAVELQAETQEHIRNGI